MNINDILLAQNIRRWTIVSTIQSQSLAEHSFNVCMIARCICEEADVDDVNVIKYALDHDLDEVHSGDIPSPAKERMGIKDLYNGKSRDLCNHGERAIVKAADLIDALLFIKYNSHDRHGKQVYDHMNKKYDLFMEDLHQIFPLVANAVENVYAMLEYGQFDVEQRS